MGQSHSQDYIETIFEDDQYFPEYEIVRILDSEIYGKVKVIKEQKTHKLMILKELSFAKKDLLEHNLKFLKERIAFDHPNFVKIIGYHVLNAETFCSNVHKILVFLEFLAEDLETQLQQRMKKNEKYSEDELFRLTDNLISILYHFEMRNMIHGDVRPMNIFCSPAGFKLTDLSFKGPSGFRYLTEFIAHDPKAFLSPQLLERKLKKHMDTPVNMFKSEVFSLGMTLLSVATLTNSEDLYDYRMDLLNEPLLSERLKMVQNDYSSFLFNLIQSMLSISEKFRPNFIMLEGKLIPRREEAKKKGNEVQGITFAKQGVPQIKQYLSLDKVIKADFENPPQEVFIVLEDRQTDSDLVNQTGSTESPDFRSTGKTAYSSVDHIEQNFNEKTPKNIPMKNQLRAVQLANNPTFDEEEEEDLDNEDGPAKQEPQTTSPNKLRSNNENMFKSSIVEFQSNLETSSSKGYLDTFDIEEQIRVALSRTKNTLSLLNEDDEDDNRESNQVVLEKPLVNEERKENKKSVINPVAVKYWERDSNIPQPLDIVIERTYSEEKKGSNIPESPRFKSPTGGNSGWKSKFEMKGFSEATSKNQSDMNRLTFGVVHSGDEPQFAKTETRESLEKVVEPKNPFL